MRAVWFIGKFELDLDCNKNENYSPKPSTPQQPQNVIANFLNDTINDFKVTKRQTFIKFLDLLCKDFLDKPENGNSLQAINQKDK